MAKEIIPDTAIWDLFAYSEQFDPDGYKKIGQYGVVDYFLLVYNETANSWNKHYLEKVLHGILAIDYPIRLKILYDRDSPTKLLTFIKKIVPKAELIQRPVIPKRLRVRLSCEYTMVWAYNQSDADYVCFNHSDDIPHPNRVYVQIQSLLHYPKAALSLGGSWFILNGETRQLGYHEVAIRGTPHNGVPSSFMLNKHVLPKFKPHWDRWDRFICCMDIILIMEILKSHEVVAVHYPLLCYNFHGIPVTKNVRSDDDNLFIAYINQYKGEWDLARFKYYPPSATPPLPITEIQYPPIKPLGKYLDFLDQLETVKK